MQTRILPSNDRYANVTAGPAPSEARPGAVGAERSARDVMQAVLFSEILKPLTDALGPAGATVVGTVTQSLFIRSQQ